MKYILDEQGEPVATENLEAWAMWFESSDRTVRKTVIGEVEVSTVFLSLDHRFGGEGPPILWETMIFGGEHDEFTDRYTSRVDAIAGHEAAVKRLQA